MDWKEAKRLVMERDARAPINRAWIAKKLGTVRQNVQQWFDGTEPRDPEVWVQIASILSLGTIGPTMVQQVRDFALEVLVRSDDPELRQRAALIVREISEKTYG